MRKWAYLKKPYICNKKDVAYKVMIYETANEGTFVFLYCSKDAMRSSFDYYYNELSDALEDWGNQIDENGWYEIDDPLPHCQHDNFRFVDLIQRSNESIKTRRYFMDLIEGIQSRRSIRKFTGEPVTDRAGGKAA